MDEARKSGVGGAATAEDYSWEMVRPDNRFPLPHSFPPTKLTRRRAAGVRRLQARHRRNGDGSRALNSWENVRAVKFRVQN